MIDAGGAPRAAAALHYGRHFALLFVLAALAALLGRLSFMPGPVAAFGLYGAMHAAALALCLRAAQPPSRKLLFVLLASLISLSIAFLGVRAAPLAAMPWGFSGLRTILAAASILGALGYGWLMRAFGLIALGWASLAALAIACALATGAAFTVGMRSLSLGSASLAVAWWLSFSGVMWWLDARRIRARMP